ncbi:uncharacterized protein LOC123524448 [Mercenaria mercenaria]|uniref:uncharacterized protein LOC123524448 n=1 Tax=Mercenaria mercenaria TaxID=6596 RepID=UPI00234F976D|nr:uncharacterized protein LOC123524448 [Mercenaria mercenaria]
MSISRMREQILGTINVIKISISKFGVKQKTLNAKPKLKVWNSEISEALKKLRQAYKYWSLSDRPRNPDHPLLVELKTKKKQFRTKCRREQARRRRNDIENIHSTRSKDLKLFYKLVNKQRQTKYAVSEELCVNGVRYHGPESVIEGFKEHFEHLAKVNNNQTFDENYNSMVNLEVQNIKTRVNESEIKFVSMEELQAAMKSVNRGKSPDYYGLTIESILYGGISLHIQILKIVNAIFESGVIPDVLKLGLPTPVFKNKGNKTEASNFRGITVLPVIVKLMEIVIKNRVAPVMELHQNPYQRGFTTNTSPLIAALIVEEISRDSKD